MKKILYILPIITLFNTNLYSMSKINQIEKDFNKKNELFDKRKTLTFGFGYTQPTDRKLVPHFELGIEALKYIENTNISYGFFTNMSFIKAEENKYAENNTVGTIFNIGLKLNYNIVYTTDIYTGIGLKTGVTNKNEDANGYEAKIGLGYEIDEKFYIALEYEYSSLKTNQNLELSSNTIMFKLNIKQ